MMPTDTVDHPALDIDVHYEAGGEMVQVGGDWYDTFEWPGGEIGVIVGDVVGHGLEAAATMGRISSAARAIAQYVGAGPGVLLDHLARYAQGRGAVDYMTVACVVLNPQTGGLAYAYGGHPNAVLIAPDGDVTWLAGGRSAPLGSLAARISGGAARPAGETVIAHGTRIVLFSDGLVERRDEPIDVGLQRLHTTLTDMVAEGAASPDATAFCATLVSRMVGVGPPIDDVIVLALLYRG